MKYSCPDASIYSHRPVIKQTGASVFWEYFRHHKKIVDWTHHTSVCASCGATVNIPNRFYADVPYKILCNGLISSTLVILSAKLIAAHIQFLPALIATSVIAFVVYLLLYNIGKNAIIAHHLAFGKWEETCVPVDSPKESTYDRMHEISSSKQRITICELIGIYFPFLFALIIKHIV